MPWLGSLRRICRSTPRCCQSSSFSACPFFVCFRLFLEVSLQLGRPILPRAHTTSAFATPQPPGDPRTVPNALRWPSAHYHQRLGPRRRRQASPGSTRTPAPGLSPAAPPRLCRSHTHKGTPYIERTSTHANIYTGKLQGLINDTWSDGLAVRNHGSSCWSMSRRCVVFLPKYIKRKPDRPKRLENQLAALSPQSTPLTYSALNLQSTGTKSTNE